MSSLPVPLELQVVISDLAHGRELTEEKVASAFDVIMRGGASPVQVAALLTGIRVSGETSAVIAGVASALRRAMIQLSADDPSTLVDTCGTGGGSITTFNISTAAALVAAGAGVRIAKHGNRSFTSKSGSADVLEALGINIDVDPAAMESALKEAGIVFMFAPRMHPAMRHVGPIRRELAIPTVMNVVGPLANPALAGRQVIGVADPDRLQIIANSLARLGTVHSLIVHGSPGMDEISPMAESQVVEIRDGEISEWTISPEMYGFSRCSADELLGGTPEENAEIVERMFDGGSTRGALTAVVLNAGAAIYVSGQVQSFEEGVKAADEAIASGKARSALERLRGALPLS